MDGGSTENPDISSMEDLGCLENINRDNTYFIFSTIMWSFILILSFLLNATLLLAFMKRPGLRTISNRFVMNLSASNILTISLLHPLLITDQSTPSGVHCALAEGATALVTTSSIFSVLLIAIDQYLAVIDPLHYRTRIDNLKCTLLIIVVWILSIVISVLAIFNANNNLNSFQQSLWQNCRSVLPTVDSVLPTDGNSSLSADFLTIYNLTYTIIYIIIIYLVPFVTIIWIYFRIYSAAHNNSERTRRTGSRPVLTVSTFTDDDYLPLRHHDSDIRIKNISSLSSIDESIEITSQLQRHLSPSPIIEEDANHVIFTVGSHNNDIINTKDNDNGDNTRPYNCHIGDFDLENRLEDLQNGNDGNLVRNEDKYGNNGKYGMPYTGHIDDFNLKNELGGHGNQSDENLKENEDKYGSNGKYGMPYTGHITNFDLERSGDLEKQTIDDLKKNMDKYGNNGNNTVPYNNNIDDYDVKEQSKDDKLEEEGEYGKYGGHNIVQGHGKGLETIGQTEYGINGDYVRSNEVPIEDVKGLEDGDNLEEEQYGKYGNNGMPYPAHINDEAVKRCLDDVNKDLEENKEEYGNNGKYGMPYLGQLQTYGPIEASEGDNMQNKYGKLPYIGHVGQNGKLYGIEEDSKDEIDGNMAQLMPPKLQRPNPRTYINSLRHRISNGSLFKYREETRAARISALVIVMGFICWTPFFTIVVIKNFAVDLYHEIDVVGVGCFLLGTIVSPMLFGYRSRRVKRELRKLFCFKRELAYKNNRSLMAKKVLKRRDSSTLENLERSSFWNFYKKGKESGKVQFVHVPETALSVDTCRSSFSSGASTQVSSTSTDDS